MEYLLSKKKQHKPRYIIKKDAFGRVYQVKRLNQKHKWEEIKDDEAEKRASADTKVEARD